jgi:hypothetical protein
MNNLEDTIYCACYSPEHALKLSYFEDDNYADSEAYISVFLREYPFWKRLWRGIKYIFGYKCKYGHFDEFVFDKDNALRFKEFAIKYIKHINRLEKKYLREAKL